MIILGDGAVGKTSVAMRHTEDNFSNVYKQTIGLDFFLKRLALPGTVGRDDEPSWDWVYRERCERPHDAL